MTESLRTIGAIIAGGASSRYGSPKALAQVAGVRVVDRVAAAARTLTDDVIAIVNDEALSEQIGLPHRADVLQHAGALAGVHAALVWARELHAHGILALACDMPFVNTLLLRALLARAAAEGADVVVPESDGPRGVEPLCAWYRISCIPAIEQAVTRGDARMIGFFSSVHVHRLPLDTVRQCGDPALLFRNINTRADLAEAERLVAEGAA